MKSGPKDSMATSTQSRPPLLVFKMNTTGPPKKNCERIARENHVSASSVRRAALFAQGVDLADELCPGIRLQVFHGVLNVPDALFERLAKAPPEEYDAIVEQIKNPLRSSSVWPGASILPF